MIRSRGWRLPALLATLFLIGVLAPATATAQPWPPDARIVGQVTQNGLPVPDVRVHVYDAVTRQHYGFTTTDANGDYAIGSLSQGMHKVQFYSADFFRNQWAHQQRSFETAQAFAMTYGQDTRVDEALLPTGTMELTAVDQVTGAQVSTFSAEAFGQGIGRNGYTEAGRVTLVDLPPGDYEVAVYPEGAHFMARGTATVTANQTTYVELEVEPAGVIETTLVDAATNAPLENACIQPVPELGVLGFYIGHCSGPDGRIRVGQLRTGPYRVFAKANDGVHGAQWVGPNRGVGSRYLARQYDVRAGQVITVPPIRLDPAGTITGKVTDATTGAPVAAMCAYPYATSTDAGP